MLIVALLIILTLTVLILPPILFSLGVWDRKANNANETTHVLYDPIEHKEYHIFGKCIFSAKCVHPKKEYYKFDVKIFELANSYFVYIKEADSQRVILEIDKFVEDPSEEAIENGLVSEEGKLTRTGLVEEIFGSDCIFLKNITREAVVPVMWKKKFIEPAIEIKK
jgi:hypothetical protein